MYEQVRLYVRTCDACARVKASFVSRDVVLHPLPIMCMFYCWSVKLAGTFPQSEYGSYYIMVMIEHFSDTYQGTLRDGQGVPAVHTLQVRGTSRGADGPGDRVEGRAQGDAG